MLDPHWPGIHDGLYLGEWKWLGVLRENRNNETYKNNVLFFQAFAPTQMLDPHWPGIHDGLYLGGWKC